jgi:hypothetical protein
VYVGSGLLQQVEKGVNQSFNPPVVTLKSLEVHKTRVVESLFLRIEFKVSISLSCSSNGIPISSLCSILRSPEIQKLTETLRLLRFHWRSSRRHVLALRTRLDVQLASLKSHKSRQTGNA